MTYGNSILRTISRISAAAVLAAATVAGVGGATSSQAAAAQRYYPRRHVVRVPQRSWNRYPSYTTTTSVRRAEQQGYADGAARGRYDRSIGRRTPNPSGHGAYQYGLNGWAQEFGSTGVYRQYYRQAFVQGYQDAFYGRSRRY